MFIIYHLYNISINLNKSYSIKADNISKNLSFIKPIRGEILDKNGKLLAINKIGFNIKINPNLDIKGEKFNKIINLIMKSFPYENKINLICGGHYHTETWGVRLLSERMSGDLGVEAVFIDVPTGL